MQASGGAGAGMPRLLPVRRHDAGTEGIAQSATRGRPAAARAVHRAPIPPAAQAVHRAPIPPAAQAVHRAPIPPAAQAVHRAPIPPAAQAVHRAPIPPAAQAVHRAPVPPAAQAAHRTPLPTNLLRRTNQNLNLLLLFHQRVKTFLNQIRQINPLGHQLIGLEITLSH